MSVRGTILDDAILLDEAAPTCRYCPSIATKLLVWKGYREGIAVCETHAERAPLYSDFTFAEVTPTVPRK